MNWKDIEDTTIYKVVVNQEQQYSIWPSDRVSAAPMLLVGQILVKAGQRQNV